MAFDAAQPVNPVEVDEMTEAREAQREHRDEALTAGQRLGVVAVLGEQPDDVGHRLWRVVLEWCRLHDLPLSVSPRRGT